MDKALDLPEVRTIVGLFLTSRDLATCCRVSKAWNASFAHMLWRNVDIRHFRPFPSRTRLEQPHISMSDSTIHQNGHRIRNLCYRGHVSPQYKTLVEVCTHLTSLHVAIAGVELPNTVAPLHTQVPLASKKLRLEPWNACAILASQNQHTLTRLILGSIVVPRLFLPSTLLKSLAQCTALSSLKLVHWLTTPVALNSLLESLINLNTFHMDSCSLEELTDEEGGGGGLQHVEGADDDDTVQFPGPSDYPHATVAFPTVLPQVKDLSITSPTSVAHLGYYLRLAQQCSNLERLTWGLADSRFEPSLVSTGSTLINPRFQGITELILSPTQWPHLQQVHIMQHVFLRKDQAFQDRQVAHIVRSRAALHSQGSKCFAFPFSELGPLTFMALSSCFANLTGLNLTEADGFASAMVQQVFESCPKLTVFKGNLIHLDDIDQGEPWICLGLKELVLYFSTTTGRNAEYVLPDSIAFGQLGRLAELRILNTSRNTSAARMQISHMESTSLLSSSSLPPPSITGRRTTTQAIRPIFQPRTLQWHLGNGLEALSGLKRLTHIQFPGDLGAGVQTRDLEWMFQHWPHLECVRGRMSSRDWEAKLLAKMVQDRGYQSDLFSGLVETRTRQRNARRGPRRPPGSGAIPSRPARGRGRGRGSGH